MRRTWRQAGDAQLVAELQAMPLGDDRRNLQWHAGAVGGLLVTGALLAVERADQQLDLAGAAEQEEPGGRERCEPRGASTSTGVNPATIGMTACAPATSARSRSTVSTGNRPLTSGVTSTTPVSAAWVSDGPNESNGRESSDLRISTSENHRHPQRDADDAEQRPAPVGDQRGEVDPPERQPTARSSCTGRGGIDCTRRPSTRCSFDGCRSAPRPGRASP